MKKLVCLVLALMLALSVMIPALAEGREAPEDRKETVTELDGGKASHFRNYAPKFWEAPCDHAGTIEKLEYTTSVYGDTLNQWANVYVPYGYDETKQYNIIYFFHGTNETQDSFIGDETVKNAIDNMIDMGICEPFIMVCPTYYYNYADRATNHAVFVDEVRNDLMPAAETKYSTYAETADEAGFIASRAHRAYSGYSQGSAVCWQVTYRCMDYAKYFVPMSGGSINNFAPLKEAMKDNEYASDVGGADQRHDRRRRLLLRHRSRRKQLLRGHLQGNPPNPQGPLQPVQRVPGCAVQVSNYDVKTISYDVRLVMKAPI